MLLVFFFLMFFFLNCQIDVEAPAYVRAARYALDSNQLLCAALHGLHGLLAVFQLIEDCCIPSSN